MAWRQALQAITQVARCIPRVWPRVGIRRGIGGRGITGSAGHTLTLSRAIMITPVDAPPQPPFEAGSGTLYLKPPREPVGLVSAVSLRPVGLIRQ